MAGGDLVYCCPMGVDREENMGDLVAFESTNGTKFGVPLPPLDVERLLPDTAALLQVVMQEFGGVGWERDILGRLRWRLPRYASALSNLVFRREGYRVADNAPTADFRIFVTDLAFDAWNNAKGSVSNGKAGR
jgi:hypothetical protein